MDCLNPLHLCLPFKKLFLFLSGENLFLCTLQNNEKSVFSNFEVFLYFFSHKPFMCCEKQCLYNWLMASLRNKRVISNKILGQICLGPLVRVTQTSEEFQCCLQKRDGAELFLTTDSFGMFMAGPLLMLICIVLVRQSCLSESVI